MLILFVSSIVVLNLEMTASFRSIHPLLLLTSCVVHSRGPAAADHFPSSCFCFLRRLSRVKDDVVVFKNPDSFTGVELFVQTARLAGPPHLAS